MDEGRPIFLQIAEQLENAIIDGSLAEGAQAPSTTELAAFHRINPATAAKGVNQLVADGVLHKRRGIGMFVSDGARGQLKERRRNAFAEQFVVPLVVEARKLGLDADELKNMIDKWGQGAAGSDEAVITQEGKR
ncbi:GntR family transcriptional regulator [Kineosporia rhizophila]|uniref:GntR family transcriptional regulator n=1 Tax=Kineosporia TaxID=49184 RepID=UPI000AF9A05B|nr:MULTISPECIES: GntR family transcriptional regulator [Kineosporia]MCE0534645.1 GntR family transcriptional regulator [Kineosporia rhizophila]GLY15564.1 GntR family transcriptional regulator [Kineosporia sp. NBRC 101677]